MRPPHRDPPSRMSWQGRSRSEHGRWNLAGAVRDLWEQSQCLGSVWSKRRHRSVSEPERVPRFHEAFSLAKQTRPVPSTTSVHTSCSSFRTVSDLIRLVNIRTEAATPQQKWQLQKTVLKAGMQLTHCLQGDTRILKPTSYIC